MSIQSLHILDERLRTVLCAQAERRRWNIKLGTVKYVWAYNESDFHECLYHGDTFSSRVNDYEYIKDNLQHAVVYGLENCQFETQKKYLANEITYQKDETSNKRARMDAFVFTKYGDHTALNPVYIHAFGQKIQAILRFNNGNGYRYIVVYFTEKQTIKFSEENP